MLGRRKLWQSRIIDVLAVVQKLKWVCIVLYYLIIGSLFACLWSTVNMYASCVAELKQTPIQR